MARILPSGRIFAERTDLPIVTPAATKTGFDIFNNMLGMADRVVQSPFVNLAAAGLSNLGSQGEMTIGQPGAGPAQDSRIQVTPRAQAAQSLLAEQQQQPHTFLRPEATESLSLIRDAGRKAGASWADSGTTPNMAALEERWSPATAKQTQPTPQHDDVTFITMEQFAALDGRQQALAVDLISQGRIAIIDPALDAEVDAQQPQPAVTPAAGGAPVAAQPQAAAPSAAGRYAATAEQMRRLAADPRLTEQEFQQLVDMVDQVAPVGYRGGNALEDMATGAHKARLMDDLMRARAGRRIEDPNADLERELLQARIDKMREPPKEKVDPNADVKRRKLEAEADKLEAEAARLRRRAKGGGGVSSKYKDRVSKAGEMDVRKSLADIARADQSIATAEAERASALTEAQGLMSRLAEYEGLPDKPPPKPKLHSQMTNRERESAVKEHSRAVADWESAKKKRDALAAALDKAIGRVDKAEKLISEANALRATAEANFQAGKTSMTQAWRPGQPLPTVDALAESAGAEVVQPNAAPTGRVNPARGAPVSRPASRPGMTKPPQPSEGKATAPSKTGNTAPAPRPGSSAPGASSEPKVKRTLADL